MAGGWGGARVGAGRKPKDKATAALHGSRAKGIVRFPGGAPPPPEPPEEPLEEIAPPRELPKRALPVWRELAPRAQEAGTLTPATATAFALLCKAIILERRLSHGIGAGSADHRGMMQRVEVGLTRFGLAPIGKPLTKPKEEDDPFAAFMPGAAAS